MSISNFSGRFKQNPSVSFCIDLDQSLCKVPGKKSHAKKTNFSVRRFEVDPNTLHGLAGRSLAGAAGAKLGSLFWGILFPQNRKRGFL